MTFQFLLYILLFRKAFFVFILTCKCECLLRFRTFNDMFEELHQKQSQWTVPDTELRESLQLAVAQILLPAYRSFVGRSGFVLISINCKHELHISLLFCSSFLFFPTCIVTWCLLPPSNNILILEHVRCLGWKLEVCLMQSIHILDILGSIERINAWANNPLQERVIEGFI